MVCPHLGLHAVVDGLAEGAGGLEPVHLGGLHAAVAHHAHLHMIMIVCFYWKLLMCCCMCHLVPRL